MTGRRTRGQGARRERMNDIPSVNYTESVIKPTQATKNNFDYK